jgi:hypothetical protein
MTSINEIIEISVNPQKKSLKNGLNCLFALHAKNFQSCLKLKESNIQCPSNCSFFVEGKPAHYREVLEKQLDIDCLYCTWEKNLDQLFKDEWIFFCILTDNPSPFCRMCLFARYKIDFSDHDSLI